MPKWEAFNLNGTVICTRRMIESLRDSAQAKQRGERSSDRLVESEKAPRKRRRRPKQ